MALFTDGNISTLEDLSAQDAAILDIAHSEHIDLTIKLKLAEEEIGIELTAVLRRLNLREGVLGPASQELTNIVVTPPLKLWHTFLTLEMAYRDAYHNQLNDRYLGRRNEYRDLARWAAEKLLMSGIGLTGNPVSRAVAPELREAWGVLEAGSYFVTVTWVGASGQEGAPAPPQEFYLAATGGFVVTPAVAPANVVGWNAYVGLTADGMRLQNPTPLSLGVEWTLETPLVTDSRLPGNGPEATSYRTAPRVIQRG